MEHETAIPEHGALLVVEIAVDLTVVTLVDVVDQSYRLVARATSPSTYGPPDDDLTRAVTTAVREIETTTSRALLHGADLIFPQDENGNGVDGVVATTSATGSMSVAIAGLSRQASVRSATHATRSTYTHLLETIALDQGGTQLGQQIAALAQSRPEVIVVAGGHEGSGASANQRLAHIVGLLSKHVPEPPRIVYAGNNEAADRFREQIGTAALDVTDNVLPLPNLPRIEPTRALLRRYYRECRVAALPGADRLKQLRVERIGSVVEDQGLMVRFLAERFGRNVLALSVDSATTTCLLASEGHYSEANFGRLGLRQGALAVLNERDAAAIQRWLPFEIDEGVLRNRLLNRTLRPRQLPSDLDDLLLDYALAREALNVAYTALRDERPRAPYDLVIAGGALAHAPRPGLAALALLDALQPTSNDSALAINFYLDQFSLLAASGALAHLNTDAAACLLEMDALNNTPLATVIVPRGDLAIGKKLAEVELKPTTGAPITRSVNAGELVRLPLARGKRATLRIRPVGGVAIGQNPAGAEVLSDEAAIAGSALGVIIDARPRPLATPDDVAQRRTVLLQWLEALDALPPATAFTPPTEANRAIMNGNGTHAEGVAEAQADEPVEVATAGNAVAALREGLVMQPEPKRGLFRRK